MIKRILFRMIMLFFAGCMAMFQIWVFSLFIPSVKFGALEFAVMWIMNYIAVNFSVKNAHILFD